jgi:hypothetical protein
MDHKPPLFGALTKTNPTCKVPVMYLITMAHTGEALALIEHFELSVVEKNLFKNDDLVLLITGEGPFEASVKTALTLSKYRFSEVINLGIAGSLSDELEIGTLLPIRTFYLIQDLKPAFKTFKSLDQGVDCLTSFERILDPEKARKLKGVAHLVDREGWGVAMAAKEALIPFRSYKMISDEAGTYGACELIKEEAHHFSLKLAHELSNILGMPSLNKTKRPTLSVTELKGFHFTHTTYHKFHQLLNKLSIKFEKTPDEIFDSLKVSDLLILDVLPKERTKLLLKTMEEKIDPTKKLMDEKMKNLTHLFQKEGLKLIMDPHLENPKVTVSFEASTDEELHQKARGLLNLSLKNFSDLMSGDLHVE